MMRKMRPFLQRLTAILLVEYSLVMAAIIVAVTNILLAFISHGL